MEILSRRSLNRATLARQHLLRRCDHPALEMIEHLVGLNAQDPDPPYVGLWSRLMGFEIDDLTRLMVDRSVVRGTLYRGTQHTVTAADHGWLRPLLHPMLERLQHNALGRSTDGIDRDELLAVARTIIADGGPRRSELGRALVARWPGRDAGAIARSMQYLLPVVHPPPDSTWGRRGQTPFALADGPSDDRRGAEDLVVRYLTAFGPASVKDIQAWSGLTRLRAAVDVLRPRLRVFRDEAGRELLDLPDAPRPGPDVEAPVRFIAPLDNVLLGYHDRTRVVDDEWRHHLVIEAPVTVDGFVRGLWRIRRSGDTATVVVRLLAPLTGAELAAVTDEAARLARFAAPDVTDHDLHLQPAETPWPASTPWDVSGMRTP